MVQQWLDDPAQKEMVVGSYSAQSPVCNDTRLGHLLIHPLLRDAIQRDTNRPEEKTHWDFVKFNRSKHKVLPQERGSRTQNRLGL